MVLCLDSFTLPHSQSVHCTKYKSVLLYTFPSLDKLCIVLPMMLPIHPLSTCALHFFTLILSVTHRKTPCCTSAYTASDKCSLAA